MKAAIVIIVLGSWGLMLIFPWWTMIFACLIAGLIGPDRGYKAFTAGLIASAGLWLVLALVADFQNGGILSAQISTLMGFPSWLIYLVTCIIGGLTGGFACLTGYLLLGRGR